MYVLARVALSLVRGQAVVLHSLDIPCSASICCVPLVMAVEVVQLSIYTVGRSCKSRQ